MSIFVIGHRNPDTDSICAAISYAYLKEQLTGRPHIAARAGNVKPETGFVLDYFGAVEPLLVSDVHPRVSDLLAGEAPVAVLPDTPLYEVGILFRNKNVKSIPVVDKHNRLVGIITLGDIAQRHLTAGELNDLGGMNLTLGALHRSLGGRFLVPGDLDKQLLGKVIIGAMGVEAMLHRIEPGDVVLTGDRENVHLSCIEAGAACILVTGGFGITDKVERLARQAGVPIMSVPFDTYDAAKRFDMSAPVSSVIQERSITFFHRDDLLEEARKLMLDTRFRSYPVVDDENRLIGVVSRYHLLAMQRKQLILVDHNEIAQAVPGIEKASVLEIIDHHRLGDLQTGEPIYYRSEPLGSTCTLVGALFEENNLTPPKEIAGLMLAAILSDTVMFKSPTCTPKDRRMAEKLAKLAEVDMEEFGMEMYSAASSLSGRTGEEIALQDFKEFILGNCKVGIGQFETMDTQGISKLQTDLLKVLNELVKNRGLDVALLMLTDIIHEGTLLLAAGNRLDLVAKAFGTLEKGAVYLPGVMSRKKQIVPPLAKWFTG